MNLNAMRAAQQEVRAVVENRNICRRERPRTVTVHEGRDQGKHFVSTTCSPLLPRESMEAVTIEGYDIPAKTRIFVNAWLSEGPEVLGGGGSIVPERFLGSEVDYKGRISSCCRLGQGEGMPWPGIRRRGCRDCVGSDASQL
ncbi:hypothetical protein HPP92_009683 [Vanilla planifolia]|uniref:Uncharacterized protein n=1 Tax=Vanilla planifolia TaxID=51239 RepID=A0A835RC00_VANPL|nr:hypothetical protein HPP92_009683 [Vanilla planifolia]